MNSVMEIVNKYYYHYYLVVKMNLEKQMECTLTGETEVLGENLLLSITKSHMTRPGFEPGPPRLEAGD
jgi:hypothetical protein